MKRLKQSSGWRRPGPATWVAWAGLLLVTRLACADPFPPWTESALPRRAVFRPVGREDDYMLVRVPVDEELRAAVATAGGLTLAARDPKGESLPCATVYGTETYADVLVQTGNRERGSYCLLYFGPGPRAGQVRDPSPLCVEQRLVASRGVPDTWDRLLYMYAHASHRARRFQATAFGEVKPRDDSNEQERVQRRGAGFHIVDLQTHVLCPTNGVYRWGAQARYAVFLLVDGELVIGRPGERYDRDWQLSAPITLTAGVHTLRLLNFAVLDPDIEVGWILPGRDEIQPVPRDRLITGRAAEHVRVERQDRSLYPDFGYEAGDAYSFRGNGACFVPVTFEDRTRNWVSKEPVTRQWQFDAAAGGQADNPTHIFQGAKRHTATLSARDNLGFEAAVTRTLDLRMSVPREYAVTAELGALPAVGYALDDVSPALRVLGLAPTGVALDVRWSIRKRDGKTVREHRLISPAGVAELLPIGKFALGDVTAIEWELSHAGVTLAGERVGLLQPPFATLPARVVGDRLYDAAGRRLVLVPTRETGHYVQPPLTDVADGCSVVCVDDMVAADSLPAATEGDGGTFAAVCGSILANAADGVRVRRVSPRSWEESPGAYGPLLKLVEIPGFVSNATDTVVLSVGLRDILELRDAEAYERSLAALADILAASRGLRIVWVTPPPYGTSSVSLRAFALAVRRIADARAMPVADLYSGLIGMGDERGALFERGGLTLSGAGQRLAGEIVARALTSAHEP